MSQIQNNASLAAASQSIQQEDAFSTLDTQVFLDLMIAELQNQDPLNPTENDELINQIYQIRQIESNDALTSTLDAVLLGQNVSSATSLIGADVVALTDAGERVSGNVRKVSIDDGVPSLDLAVAVSAEAGEPEGGVAEGGYVYEVVWQNDDGAQFSVALPVNTDSFADFNGSIDISNLPTAEGVTKRVYRTDASGTGERRFVAQLDGLANRFTDTTADADRGEALTGPRQQLEFARRATVTLNNIAEITPPE